MERTGRRVSGDQEKATPGEGVAFEFQPPASPPPDRFAICPPHRLGGDGEVTMAPDLVAFGTVWLGWKVSGVSAAKKAPGAMSGAFVVWADASLTWPGRPSGSGRGRFRAARPADRRAAAPGRGPAGSRRGRPRPPT